ncbi:PHA/PHB synthase family protein [Aestuariispira ectoiniformans]|uniref:PHA/PHB synthase family protein n=1 Tax=Aestuariispira ectoiniformans TaxID=2775080 RepID=UPI00223BDA01|nr:class I poly(R)-hydroxyalkanoic acid synthase [Aestuariispira ectoiniformans]
MSEQNNSRDTWPDPVEWTHMMSDVAERSQQLVANFLEHQQSGQNAATGHPDPLNIGQAFFHMTQAMLTNPQTLMEAQGRFWQDYMALWQTTTQRMFGDETGPVIEPDQGDKRFKDETWEQNTLFDFIKQSYLLTARFLQESVHDLEGLDEKHAKKVEFYTNQFAHALAPTNFLMTNPTALKETLDSRGENLVNGLQNLLNDIDRGKGRLKISMTDPEAFEVGVNIATTPGKVVYQNELMQLIQYTPTTEQVYKRPLLIVPPWINKFYILDLKEKNSFIRWAVSQGHTVFIISWVNPDRNLANKTFEDYMLDGPFAALDAIEKATGETEVNAIGYCLGGTLLSATLAYMAAKDDKRIKSATFFTTMVDFEDAGELSIFIDEEQLEHLEHLMHERGYLDGSEMATTFNMLRANDLIWSFVVNNYLMGRQPFPFDLLYWNSDSTRMPAAMHSFYLRNMYQENRLIKPGEIELLGEPIDLRKIEIPTFILSTREDHIAPWEATYRAISTYRGNNKFVLAGSGHIAGVINPPGDKIKYGYWTNTRSPKTPDEWLATAKEHSGSWWPEWQKWIARKAGTKVTARQPGDGKLKVLEDAPGSFVKMRTE